MKANLIIAFLATFILVAVPTSAQQVPPLQVTPAPVMSNLSLDASPSVRVGEPAPLRLNLTDQYGAPIDSDKDIRFNVRAVGSKPDRGVVVIPKGESSAIINVASDSPGISSVSVEPASPISAIAETSTRVAFTPPSSYKPHLPLSLLLSVLPSSRLRAVLDKAQVTVYVVDQTKVPVSAPYDFDLSFPGLDQVMTPNPLHINAGSTTVTGTAATQTPGNYQLKPIVTPPTSVMSDTQTLVFENPIQGLRILADPSYVKTIFRPHIKIKIGLYDVRGNWIPTDHDLTIILRVDPAGAGQLGVSDITLNTGKSTFETTFIPSAEGVATISALTEKGLNIDPAKPEFHFAFVVFLIVAGVGGVAGSIARNATQTLTPPKKRFVLGAIAGAFFGMLAYLLAPVIVSVSFKPEVLQNGSKLFEAFLWGFAGGGGGASLFAKFFPNAGAPTAAVRG